MTQSPWFEAIIDPAAILTLVIAAIAGLVAAWWLFPIGVLLWLIMFLTTGLDPSLRLNETIQSRKDLPQRFQPGFSRLQKTQVSLFNSFQGARPGFTRSMQPVMASINDLINQAYDLCQRLTPLENYQVVSAPETNLDDELKKINAEIEAATDPAAKQQYIESAKTLKERSDRYKEVIDRLTRFDALMESLANEMEFVQSEAIQAISLKDSEVRQRVPEMLNRLKQEKDQLKSFG